jgi:hypothetical protein
MESCLLYSINWSNKSVFLNNDILLNSGLYLYNLPETLNKSHNSCKEIGNILKESLNINLLSFQVTSILINLCKSSIIELTLLISISGNSNRALKMK